MSTLRYAFNYARLVPCGEVPLRDLRELFRGADSLAGSRPQSNPAIPRRLFTTWQRRWITRSCFSHWERVARTNPDYDFYLFDDEEVDRYMRQRWQGHPILDVFRSATLYPLKADIWRYCVLFDKGGLYSDIKSSFQGSFDSIIDGEDRAVLGMEPHRIDASRLPSEVSQLAHGQDLQHWLLNYFLVFSPGHRLLGQLIEQIVREAGQYFNRLVDKPKAHILDLTGPIALTRAYLAYRNAGGDDVRINGVEYGGRSKYMAPGGIHIYKSMNPPAPHYSTVESGMLLVMPEHARRSQPV